MKKEIYKEAIAAVQEAGEILAKSFGKVEVLRFKTDSGTDVVTQLDIDTENFIEERLWRNRQSYSCLCYLPYQQSYQEGFTISPRTWISIKRRSFLLVLSLCHGRSQTFLS